MRYLYSEITTPPSVFRWWVITAKGLLEQPLVSFMLEKAVVFIDGSNFYNGAKRNGFSPRVHFHQQKFFTALQRTPLLTLRLGRLERRDDHYVDMLSMAYKNAYDLAILVTADADFVPAVQEAKSFGKRVFNAYFRKGISYHLSQACDRFLLIDQTLIEKVKG